MSAPAKEANVPAASISRTAAAAALSATLASDDPTRFADIGNPLRRWLEVDPLPVASGPADRRIPFVTIVSDQIGGIGYCPPPDGTDGPPPGGARR